MKARNYIQQLMLLLIPVGLLTACTSDEEGGSLPNEGKVPVTVQLCPEKMHPKATPVLPITQH